MYFSGSGNCKKQNYSIYFTDSADKGIFLGKGAFSLILKTGFP
jgi:hypothetical protein